MGSGAGAVVGWWFRGGYLCPECAVRLYGERCREPLDWERHGAPSSERHGNLWPVFEGARARDVKPGARCSECGRPI